MTRPKEEQVRAGIDRFVRRMKEAGADPAKAREKARELAIRREKKADAKR